MESSSSVVGFEDLEVFKKAYRVSLEIHEASLRYPKYEQYSGLADQMRRASKGICANIAESYGKLKYLKGGIQAFYGNGHRVSG